MKCPRCDGTGQLDHVPLGERLRALRESRGLSLRDVTDRVDCSTANLNKIECGQTKAPSVFLVAALAAFYEVELAELLEQNDG